MRELLRAESEIRQGRYLFLPRKERMESSIAGLAGCQIEILTIPDIGAKMVDYLLHIGLNGDTGKVFCSQGMEYFFYVCKGQCRMAVDGEIKNAVSGDFLHVPPGHEIRIEGKAGQASVFIHKQRYTSYGDVEPKLLWGNADQKMAKDTNGEHSQTLKKLLGDSLDYDMAANILGFDPGVGFNQVETHAEEHGIYVLSGQACFMLDRKWIMVGEGDFLWLAPYTPHACYGLGETKFNYLLVKNTNRDYQLM